MVVFRAGPHTPAWLSRPARRGLSYVPDRVIWLTAGTTHGLGTPEEAREHPRFVREYLGPARRGRRQLR